MTNDVERWLREEGKVFLEDIGIKKGQSVLDFGCGAGHYTIPAAKLVGNAGKVYALDKDTEVLKQLTQTAESEGLKNIVQIADQSQGSRIDLEDQSIDAMLLYDVLHYMESEGRRRVYEFAYRILKTGAMFSVYPKHCKSDEPLWNLAEMELEDVIDEIESSGFCFESEFFKRLVHNKSHNMGRIVNFRKTKER
jgi:ubiquinone/menaquinone biosynthesis C-methylase UbiE